MTAPQASLFDGKTLDPALDAERLQKLLGRVYVLMAGLAMEFRRWWTLAELKAKCGGSEAGISARLRDLRKPKFGGHVVARRRRGDPKAGLWEYRMVR